MRVVVHLKTQCYEKLVGNARPGSKAEACLNSAVYRQMPTRADSEYVLCCDERAISVLASLAALVCPEALLAMMRAYREARTAE
jgi:hypothetical protein